MLAIAPAYPYYPAEVGGVCCIIGDVEDALCVLRLSAGLMVRQPLERAGSPLAHCDYHAVAAPYKPRFALQAAPVPGRGAAGRHITKLAFCHALSAIVAVARVTSPVAALAGITQRAWDAFARDPGYAEEMARAAARLPARIRDSDSWTASSRLELQVLAV